MSEKAKEGVDKAKEGLLTSPSHWRCDTTGVCCTGWRSPSLSRSGFAGPNIFVA